MIPDDDLIPRASDAPNDADALPASSPPPAPRGGRARARQAQRRRTHTETAQSTVRARQPRQIRPLDGLKLPTINLPINRPLIGIIAAVAFVVLIVFGLGRLRNDPDVALTNAIWIGREWTLEPRTAEEIAAFAESLRGRRIGVIYAWVSWLQPDGSWNGEAAFDNLTAFRQAFKTAYPAARLYGWISLPTEVTPGVRRIADPALQAQVASLGQTLIATYGFDGVFLNADPVWSGDQDYLALLRAVRAAVGLQTPIGVALPPDWTPADADVPQPPSIAPGTVWATPYKQNVMLLVDHIAVMAFQSGFTSLVDYSAWVAHQVVSFTGAAAELNTPLEIVIGVPTLPDGTPRFDPGVENIDSAVAGVREGIRRAGNAGSYITGIALYPEWETSADEWAAYQRAWIERR